MIAPPALPLLIRLAAEDDLDAMGAIAEAGALFSRDVLVASDPAGPDGPGLWLVALRQGALAGFLFAEPARMADRVWELRTFAVAPGQRRTGVARALVTALSDRLAQDAIRMLTLETSSARTRDAARATAEALGFREEARLADLWAEGEDKVILVRRIAPLAMV